MQTLETFYPANFISYHTVVILRIICCQAVHRFCNGCCRYVPFHRGLQLVSIDRHVGDSDVNLETFFLFFISHSSTFLSVCGTWIYRLLPALHAHLPCTTLLNSEECALLEKKKKKSYLSDIIIRVTMYSGYRLQLCGTIALPGF